MMAFQSLLYLYCQQLVTKTDLPSSEHWIPPTAHEREIECVQCVCDIICNDSDNSEEHVCRWTTKYTAQQFMLLELNPAPHNVCL